MDIIKELFVEWKLDTWANILEVVGFLISALVLIIGFFIKSDLNKLKTDILFEKRIIKHLKNLKENSSKINNYLNDYNNNFNEIKNEFGLCRTELIDLKEKIPKKERYKIKNLIRLIKSLKNNKFEFSNGATITTTSYEKRFKRIYSTNIEDIWDVYGKLQEVIRQMENLKENKAKSK